VETLLLASVGLLLLAWLGRSWMQSRPEPERSGHPVFPAGVSLKPQPLMSTAEASLYNLIRLAVQDRYLLFAQVPVWCLVEIQATDREARAAFLSKIALRRVSFVLAHPGTLAAALVVDLDDQSPSSVQGQARERLVQAVCQTAGIELVRLNLQRSYTVPQLASLLDLDPAEESAEN
jgi:hypothetical protein